MRQPPSAINPLESSQTQVGNLYIVDTGNNRVRIVNTAGTITTFAGIIGNAEGLANAALYNPRGITIDQKEDLYIADFHSHRIRKLSSNGAISTVAGTGAAGYSGDGGPAIDAQLLNPTSVAYDRTGNLYLTDFGNHRVRKIDQDGKISTIAGTGTAGYSGDGGPAVNAEMNGPYSVAVDWDGNLFIAEINNHLVRKVDTNGVISTIAGTGTAGFSGDGGPAAAAQLNTPFCADVDSNGIIYIADTANHRIRKLDLNGEISTFAGTGTAGFSGDNGPGANAMLNSPRWLTLSEADFLYIADTGNNRIRRMNSSGAIVTYAG